MNQSMTISALPARVDSRRFADEILREVAPDRHHLRDEFPRQRQVPAATQFHTVGDLARRTHRARVHHRLHRQVGEGVERRLPGTPRRRSAGHRPERGIRAFVATYEATGSRVVSLSSTPEAFAGKGGDVLIDEAISTRTPAASSTWRCPAPPGAGSSKSFPR